MKNIDKNVGMSYKTVTLKEKSPLSSRLMMAKVR